MEQNIPVAVPSVGLPQPPKSNKSLIVLLSVLLLLSISTSIFFAIQIKKLINQPTRCKSGSEASSELTFSDIYNKIKSLGSISGAKTVNIDNWTSYSNVLNESKSIKYNYQYPDNLYAVPNVRGGTNSLYFFENKEAYQKYISCINDKTIIQSEVVTRDWEGGCDAEGDFLFAISVSFSNGDGFISNKPSTLVSYYGPNDDFTWTIPKDEESMLGGGEGHMTMYADGKTRSGDQISVALGYDFANPSIIGKIKSLTKMDIYTLFVHILSTFKFTE